MSIRTIKEIEKLKRDWEADPCWDLESTEGFEAHADELQRFQMEKNAEWKAEYAMKERAIDEKAEELGVKGIYRLILEMQELQNRHNKAIALLADGKSYEAYRALNGYAEE